MPLLDVHGLRTHFPTDDGVVKAVDGVDLTVEPGATIGIVGESGSGKSVFSMTILGLVPTPPAVVDADAVLFEGRDLRKLSGEEFRRLRGDRIAMIFQDPMTSLNPFLKIGDQLTEPLSIHRPKLRKRDAWNKMIGLLAEVGIDDPERRMKQYPHLLSGGMRQRVMIAMALACDPALLIADEPTTALDVTIQAQILEKLQRIRKDHGTAIILITHDLGVAAGFCDMIYVMYAGKIVEHARTADLFRSPRHPYTKALLASVPRLDDLRRDRFTSIEGEPPDLTRLPAGCSFAPRCRYVQDRCRKEIPPLEPVADGPARRKACFVDVTTAATV